MLNKPLCYARLRRVYKRYVTCFASYCVCLQQLELCVLCKTNTTEKLCKLTEQGLETLRTACQLRHSDEICQVLDNKPDVFVHSSCRKSFTRTKDLKRLKLQLEEMETPSDRPVVLRSSSSFMWKTMCFICALPVAGSSNTRRVSTFELGQKILAQCAQRSDD